MRQLTECELPGSSYGMVVITDFDADCIQKKILRFPRFQVKIAKNFGKK